MSENKEEALKKDIAWRVAAGLPPEQARVVAENQMAENAKAAEAAAKATARRPKSIPK